MRKTARFLFLSTLCLSPLTIQGTILAAPAAATLAPEVSLEELTKFVGEKSATIIDANSVQMYKDGHVPGAISFATQQDKLAQVLPQDKSALIVAYCGGPRCTAWEEAATAVKKLGYTNVKHFKGGIKGWKDAGKKVDTAS